MAKAKDKKQKERRLYVADFETKVEPDFKMNVIELKDEKIDLVILEPNEQEETEVRIATICPVLKRPEPSDAAIYNNIYEFIDHLSGLEDGSIVFFHNAKFDSSFILVELNREGFVQSMSMKRPDHYSSEWELSLSPYSYTLCMSNMGQFYNMKIRFSDRTIEIRDSAKKIPSTLRQIGKDFATKYQKLEMEYDTGAGAFSEISEDEKNYAINDVLVLSEAMYIIWYDYNMRGLTIAADSLESYKNIITEPVFDGYFPDLTEIELPCQMEFFDETTQSIIERAPNVYEYCQRGYAGGWCYQNPICRNKVFLSDKKFSNMVNGDYVPVKNIIVADVNSLYPSRMITDFFPIGKPQFNLGEPTKKECDDYCVYRRFSCRFRIKKGYLPFIHIRKSPWYHANECLTTTDVFGSRYVKGQDTKREFVMTDVEFQLFKKHYDILNYSPIDYLCFEKIDGETLFGPYINHYREMKIQATKEKNKAKRTISKMFMNSLYGKLSSSCCSSYKTIHFEDDTIKFDTHVEYEKKPIAISTGAWITACARKFTIEACQQNYFEGELRGFMYADTDSAHMVDMDADDVKGMKFDPSEFNCWDVEVSKCGISTYAKQKTYIEVATEESFEPVVDKDGNPRYNIIMKAAGLSQAGKDIFTECLLLDENHKDKTYISDFKNGLVIFNCNLKATNIKGGILLKKTDFRLS